MTNFHRKLYVNTFKKYNLYKSFRKILFRYFFSEQKEFHIYFKES